MNSKRNKINAFTIIELLTVIAVIAILSSILIPITGGVIRQSRIAASKAQLWQYVTAIENFKAEYGYYSRFGGTVNNLDFNVSLAATGTSEDFVETLSGRVHNTGAPVTNGGNTRQMQFHNFSDAEFFLNTNGSASTNRLADRFNNTNIWIRVDGSGDGFVRPFIPGSNDPQDPSNDLRTGATAWVSEVPGDGLPGYGLWE